MPRKSLNQVDKFVGRNIRLIRLAKGLSQTALARDIGVAFQQVQKYENGSNRVGSGRLFLIAKVLGVDIKALFAGCELPKHSAEEPLLDFMVAPQSFRLVQAFSEIENPEFRKLIVELVKALANADKPHV